ncbi:hypothetical protein Nepgr_026409 [Nepenthes gracilis]|uniref:D-2-hydroxyglutarate dehydrogenase n=1 Tax=Nepenthes gracilis TaxID=150966 RepID=A0AAD3T8J3_NEPGR|nr:hypothetical protein Nepgr_026409 [Nepenthes gracilis]
MLSLLVSRHLPRNHHFITTVMLPPPPRRCCGLISEYTWLSTVKQIQNFLPIRATGGIVNVRPIFLHRRVLRDGRGCRFREEADDRGAQFSTNYADRSKKSSVSLLEDGVILDFAGPNFVCVDNFAFGSVTRYVLIDKEKLSRFTTVSATSRNANLCTENRSETEILTWDDAIRKSMQEFQHRSYNLLTCNCHSFVAHNLNLLRIDGSGWNVVNLAALIFLKGRWVSTARGNLNMERRKAAYHALRHFSRSLFDHLLRCTYGHFRLQLNSGSIRNLVGTFQQSSSHLEQASCNPVAPLYQSSDLTDFHQASRTKLSQQSFSPRRRSYGSAATFIQKNPAFSEINSDDISYFKNILGHNNVIQDEDRLQSANTDWMHKYKGSSKLMLQPRNTEEVSQILKYCNSRCLAVVPQGGNTGLVGGSVPVFNEVIINLGLMNKILSFDQVSGVLVCEAGCILENLAFFLDNEGFVMPLDLGAKGSCQIGGNVSTNAGGLRLVRYGSLHGNVLGLEAVLANGTVLDMLKTLRKDNTGYDLKHLFIGSEGSLGIVTKVSILTPPKLSAINLAFLACDDYLSCQKLLLEAKRKLGEVLSAFEFLDSQSMDLVLNHLEGVRNPLAPSVHNFYVLIETTGSGESFDKDKLEAFLFRSMESGLISDGVIAQDINQASSFWRIREGVAEALIKAGITYKYDLSLPVEKMYDLVEEMRMRLGHSAKVLGFGHMGDGNLHLNISAPKYDDAIFAQIEPFVYEWTSKHRGSISAEHGLGLMKANAIHYSKSPEAVQLMVSIKKLLDANGILNPYKVLPCG